MEQLLRAKGCRAEGRQAMVVNAAENAAGVSLTRAFAGRRGITTVILYPQGPLYGLSPADFVPNGGSIIPIQVRGALDDCQRLVNGLVLDRAFSDRYCVTSANSINIGRITPQSFYYIWAAIRLKQQLSGELVFSVPSGNFGNLISGLYAWKFGLPVSGFIAAQNRNNPCGDVIRGKGFAPRTAVATNSPALDVGCPSNYERLAAFYREAPIVMRNLVHSESVEDEETLETIAQVWKDYGILLGSAGAVAYAAARRMGASLEGGSHTVVLCTGHASLEADLVEKASGQRPPKPPELAAMERPFEPLAVIDGDLEALEGAITACF
jgi:threonine synthase